MIEDFDLRKCKIIGDKRLMKQIEAIKESWR